MRTTEAVNEICSWFYHRFHFYVFLWLRLCNRSHHMRPKIFSLSLRTSSFSHITDLPYSNATECHAFALCFFFWFYLSKRIKCDFSCVNAFVAFTPCQLIRRENHRTRDMCTWYDKSVQHESLNLRAVCFACVFRIFFCLFCFIETKRKSLKRYDHQRDPSSAKCANILC